MERKLSILLVEDDQDACNNIIDYIEELEDVSLVASTNHSSKAIEYVQDYMPDAIILDLELHLGGGNGLIFMKELKSLDLDFSPYILVTTNNSSSVTYDYARQLGADFIMAKHQSDYSAEAVVEFLRMMKDVIFNKISLGDLKRATTESPEQKNKRIKRIITLELNYVGISPKAVGYRYLVDAIQLVVKRPTNNLCAIIGAKYGKSDFSVERAMQNAINRAWRTADVEDLMKHYTAKIHSEKGVPTITEFVFYYANKINDV